MIPSSFKKFFGGNEIIPAFLSFRGYDIIRKREDSPFHKIRKVGVLC